MVQVYDTPIISRNRLAEIVIDKEKRAKNYQECNEYWLLVVVDFINSSQDQEIQIEGFEKIQTNIFEKVIVFKTLFNHIIEDLKFFHFLEIFQLERGIWFYLGDLHTFFCKYYSFLQNKSLF